MSAQALVAPPLPAPRGDDVVLLDHLGRPCGAAPRHLVHGPATPLHLAFSCHVVDGAGRVLVTRRSLAKRTWPGVWSNACCGHPRPGETLRQAVTRRLQEELGVTPTRLGLAIADFTYRAAMDDGTVEHELCPVVVAQVDDELAPDPAEVDATAWTEWDLLRRRAEEEPRSLSPWSVRQIDALARLAPTLTAWLEAPPSPRLDDHVALDAARLRPVVATDGRPAAAGAVVAAVDRHIEDFVAERLAGLVRDDPRSAEVVTVVRDLLAHGGKRLRPELVLWGHVAAGGDADRPGPEVVAAGAAVELLHTFALIHDDVMDRSALRRGRPTAQVVFAEMAGASEGADRPRRTGSDPAWFGISAALLAGDLASAWADEVFASVADRDARAEFDAMRTEVMAGQYLDLRLAFDDDPDDEAATRVALLKSARYTVTRPLLIGAALGGAPPAVVDALRTYGDSAGLAFQMRDDVLGLFGDPGISGKSRLDDLREGKRTLLVVRALRLADTTQREVLLEVLGDADLDERGARVARDIVAATGALASVEALIADRQATAAAAADALPAPARRALRAMAERLSHRGV